MLDNTTRILVRQIAHEHKKLCAIEEKLSKTQKELDMATAELAETQKFMTGAFERIAALEAKTTRKGYTQGSGNSRHAAGTDRTPHRFTAAEKQALFEALRRDGK